MSKQQVVVARYEPNYTRLCSGCDQSPTVTAIFKDGKKQEMDLCGPCCFGEAACIDPNIWNLPAESRCEDCDKPNGSPHSIRCPQYNSSGMQD